MRASGQVPHVASYPLLMMCSGRVILHMGRYTVGACRAVAQASGPPSQACPTLVAYHRIIASLTSEPDQDLVEAPTPCTSTSGLPSMRYSTLRRPQRCSTYFCRS